MEDFRIMIGQSIGLSTPVPLAMVIVEADPFAEGDFYPGDLLTALLSLDSGWWQGSDDLRCRFVAMLRTLPKAHPALTKGIERFLTS